MDAVPSPIIGESSGLSADDVLLSQLPDDDGGAEGDVITSLTSQPFSSFVRKSAPAKTRRVSLVTG